MKTLNTMFINIAFYLFIFQLTGVKKTSLQKIHQKSYSQLTCLKETKV